MVFLTVTTFTAITAILTFITPASVIFALMVATVTLHLLLSST
jgi:hypothetical protein